MSQPPNSPDHRPTGQVVAFPPPPIEPEGYAVGADPATALGRRPGAVVAGCVLAWIGSAVGMLAGVFALAISESSDLLDQIADEADRGDAARLMHVSGAVTLVWCLAVAVFAFFAFRRSTWAARALVVMAGIVVALSVINLSVTGSPGAAPALIWSALSAFLVYGAKRSRDWFKAAR